GAGGEARRRSSFSGSLGGFGLGGLSENLEEEFFVEAGELPVGGDGEQLVGEIHQDAVISGSMVCEGDAQLAGHERGVSCGCEQVIETGEQLIAGGVLEGESPADARSERE